MEIYLKSVCGVLIAVVLIQALSKSEKNMALLISIVVCCMIFTAIGTLFKPILSFFEKLQSIGNLNSDMIKIIMKVVGIGYLSEITGNLCQDIGNAAMSKVLQILSMVTLLALSIPIFNELLGLIESVLSNI